MRSISLPSLAGSIVFLGSLGILTLSCSPGDPTGPEELPPPTRGSLRVSVQTTGVDADGDGYVVNVTGRANQSVPSNGSTLFEDLSPGVYTVNLSGVAANCTVSGGGAREVTVIAGPTTATSFVVSCVALVGGLQVTTVTTGGDVDPDGYDVTVDGTTTQTVGSSGTISFADLAAGTHSVELTGVEENCSVSGTNPRNVTIAAGGSAQTTFNVVCEAQVGDLTVTTSTTGQEVDPDGYVVSVDGILDQAIGVNGTATFANVTAGTHSVELAGLAANCSVSGTNPQTVAVVPGETASADFTVSCDAVTGSADIVIETEGPDQDPDGYTVTLDAGSSKASTVNDTITFSNISPGDHSVELAGLSQNCSVPGANPKTITVIAGATVEGTFSVTCTSLSGELRVSATTMGDGDDPDGFVASIDGGQRTTRIDANGSTGFGSLSSGDHEVALLDVAANCAVFGDNPRTVAVIGGQVVETNFAVECVATKGIIRVRSSTVGASADPDGYIAELDGGFRTTRIGPNDETGFGNLDPGDHAVGITDVAANCTVLGENPRTVNLSAGEVELVTFGVECSEPMTCVEPPPGLVSWWSGDGTTADIEGSNDGIPQGNLSYEQGFVLTGGGQAFSLDGGSQVQVSDNALLNPTGSPGFSFEVWANSSQLDTDAAVVAKGGGGGGEQYQLGVSHGHWRGFIRTASGSAVQLTAPMVAGVFNHLALTWDGGTLILYVNGVAATSTSVNTIQTSDTYLGIGARPGGFFFTGLIDELSYYSRALSPSEVAAIYSAGSAGKCK